jgi:acetylglutamate kinase
MPMKSHIAKADVLLESLPYMRRFFGTTMVIKYGGHAMANDTLKESFAQDVVLLKFLGMNPVIVHGGGPQIDGMLRKLGIESRFVRGMRVTDRATMDVVEMVLVGKINKEIVALVNRHGGQAVGLSGKDGELIIGRKMQLPGPTRRARGEDIGMVGEVLGVNPRVIQALDSAKFIPVIAPIGVGRGGETFNINADLVASKVAQALQAEKLILLTDVEGIKDREGGLVPTLPADEAATMIRTGVIARGMIPKVECCIDALKGGVTKTHIVDGRVRHAILLEIFTAAGVGTEVVRNRAGKVGRVTRLRKA